MHVLGSHIAAEQCIHVHLAGSQSHTHTYLSTEASYVCVVETLSMRVVCVGLWVSTTRTYLASVGRYVCVGLAQRPVPT